MSQEQRVVDVVFLSGGKSEAVATGNNATWHCACGNIHWLIGRTWQKQQSPKGRVICPVCGKKYLVDPAGMISQKRAARVREIP